MKSRDIVRLFFSTLLLGAVATLITSFFVKAGSYKEFLQPLDVFEVFGLLLFFTALGFVFSLISQMGFFAYLTINQFGLSMFKGFWSPIQIILIAFTLFDLVYFRFRADESDTSLITYIIVALAIFIYGWIVSGIKAKETNRKAFVPALFFMVVVTAIEWVPGIRTSGGDYAWLMIVPLLICNTYQLLVLHRLTNKTAISDNKKNSK
ncbi:KinB-signaling pathway activation protein [Aquibacillus rhizosphaerae]|uniref:KinB-signaling pathway activation protein n=1 Tax=Aquibacillus rhizosphaerae TaxID=3051431 RepID=A0ABT7L6C8_9BACI|nr:KinB-signaling pathway activation protein [Aquibacillus sp. LR5S19]MDL4841424.1 KinB-signaling pathway activation protein [Aquibacillus sp. LR5S19]